MITHPPEMVNITFDKNDLEGWYSVVVRDIDGMLVCAGPMKVIDAWLKRHGYEWIIGTNGAWRRG